MAGARAKANQIKCASNLRQISVMYHMAVEADAGLLWVDETRFSPTDVATILRSGLAEWWAGHLGQTNEGWICPSAPEAPLATGASLAPFGEPAYTGSVSSAWRAPGLGTWFTWDGSLESYLQQEARVGSYAHNSWLGSSLFVGNGSASPDWYFKRESEIRHPSRTPVFADGVHFSYLWPTATDLPAVNLQTGEGGGGPSVYYPGHFGMNMVTIPRHGSRPSRVPTDQRPEDGLPGAINVACCDGHVELVKLERLWQLYWHSAYQLPAKRPGLK